MDLREFLNHLTVRDMHLIRRHYKIPLCCESQREKITDNILTFIKTKKIEPNEIRDYYNNIIKPKKNLKKQIIFKDDELNLYLFYTPIIDLKNYCKWLDTTPYSGLSKVELIKLIMDFSLNINTIEEFKNHLKKNRAKNDITDWSIIEKKIIYGLDSNHISILQIINFYKKFIFPFQKLTFDD